ncbi:MAG: Kazal-type serine protease inhibitor [Nanoarchaeota archaeon]|nr:Kazal-type serine protease inhibitor [Nanoarchaeota archaeon]
MQSVRVVLMVGLLLLLASCTTNIEQTVKQLPAVEQFLAEHPNAEMTISFWEKSYVDTVIGDLRLKCGEQLGSKDYYMVSVKEDNSQIWLLVDDVSGRMVCLKRDIIDVPPEESFECDKFDTNSVEWGECFKNYEKLKRDDQERERKICDRKGGYWNECPMAPCPEGQFCAQVCQEPRCDERDVKKSGCDDLDRDSCLEKKDICEPMYSEGDCQVSNGKKICNSHFEGCQVKSNEKVCAQEWNPVCGSDGNTYRNACFASRAGIKVVAKGACSQPDYEKEKDSCEKNGKKWLPCGKIACSDNGPCVTYCGKPECVDNDEKKISQSKALEIISDYFNKEFYGVKDGCGKFNNESGKLEPDNLYVKEETNNGYVIVAVTHCGFAPTEDQLEERTLTYLIEFDGNVITYYGGSTSGSSSSGSN